MVKYDTVPIIKLEIFSLYLTALNPQFNMFDCTWSLSSINISKQSFKILYGSCKNESDFPCFLK